jgi:outer membrane protein
MRAGVASVAVAAGLLALFQTGAAAAAESGKVGVIQQRAIVEKTKVGKRKLEEMRAFQASRQQIISADDQELKKLEDELKSQEGGLSESAKMKKQEQFRVKFEAYQRKLQDFQRELQQKQKQMSDDMQKKIDEAVQAVADKGGFVAVLDEGGVATIQVVLYAHPSVDLTERVIKEFDRRNK